MMVIISEYLVAGFPINEPLPIKHLKRLLNEYDDDIHYYKFSYDKNSPSDRKIFLAIGNQDGQIFED